MPAEPRSSDFAFQLRYVAGQIPRILSMQDANAVSPSHGCFHYGYWRDKTSEFADARFQEAGAMLAMLALPESREALGDQALPEDLSARVSAALKFWERSQHRDGSFDEWYKHEHGFAATEFTVIAFGAAAWLGGDRWSAEDLARYRRVAARAGACLLKRDDLVKANHEMAAAAALALLAKTLGDPAFAAGARLKYERALALRNPEGWFNEIAGMDLGYCSVLLDYAMLYHHLSGDERVPAEMARLFRFMFPFLHPDLTISAEAGLCLNPYVSRLGALLLAPHCPEAAWFCARLSEREVGFAGVSPYLADDLRLCRWGYLPLLTHALGRRIGLLNARGALAGALPQQAPPLGLTRAREANVLAFRSERLHAVFLPAGGGQVRVYTREGDSWRVSEQLGRVHALPDGTSLCSAGYERDRAVRELGPLSFELRVAMYPARFFYPGLIPRLGLRLLGAIPGLAIWLRRGIDWYRRRNRTAINQSAAPGSGKAAPVTLRRVVEFSDGAVTVKDSFEGAIAGSLVARSEVFGCAGS